MQVVACIGGGSNAIGTFYPFIKDKVKLYGVEAQDKGLILLSTHLQLEKDVQAYFMVQNVLNSR